MTEAEWNACADPFPMLAFLPGKASERKLRLFACACCRQIWDLLTDERSRRAVEVAERFADGLARLEELNTVQEEAWASRGLTWVSRGVGAVGAWVARETMDNDVVGWVIRAADALNEKHVAGSSCTLIRCIFGPLPFRPVTLNPAWLTPAVTMLSQAIYDERAFDHLPILADALSESGCDNQDILSHCRKPGEHVKGCWVLDLLLGRS